MGDKIMTPVVYQNRNGTESLWADHTIILNYPNGPTAAFERMAQIRWEVNFVEEPKWRRGELNPCSAKAPKQSGRFSAGLRGLGNSSGDGKLK